MPRYPHTKLFSDPRRTVVLSGPHIHVLETQTGHIIHSTTNIPREDEDALVNSGPIRCSGMSKDGRYLATAGDDKRLKVWDLELFTLLSTRELPKKPTCIEFSKDADILVSDKFGDVFRWSLPRSSYEEAVGDALANPSDGQLVLGHASVLTSCLLTPQEKYIITADRDEHIRVSWYPEGYVIQSYCLGHKKYVSALHVPPASPSVLISGGGDPELKVWDWMTGSLRQNITICAAVEPFIRVMAQDRTHRSLAESDGEQPVRSREIKATVGKQDRHNTTGPNSEVSADHEPSEGPNLTSNVVLVIRKIASFVSCGENHVVFSVVGATAIFDFVLTETSNQPDIRHYDFKRPVIDFALCEDGVVWALLDADFQEDSDVTDALSYELVRVVRWSVDKFVDAGSSALLDSLNATCSVPATAEELRILDLYADLSSLPKTVDQKQSRGLEQSRSIVDDELSDEGTSVSVKPTKRTLGRLKHKRALDQLGQERGASHENARPKTKKTKADSDIEESHSGQDE